MELVCRHKTSLSATKHSETSPFFYFSSELIENSEHSTWIVSSRINQNVFQNTKLKGHLPKIGEDFAVFDSLLLRLESIAEYRKCLSDDPFQFPSDDEDGRFW